MTTNIDLDLAREWAQTAINTPNNFPKGRAAAEVIQSLPDEWIDAEKLREVIEEYDSGESGAFIDDLRALLPEPTPRTLADMGDDQRKACQWMQADFDDGIAERPIRVVITKIRPTVADIILPDGAVHFVYPDKLTPLPDLPRMVWPDEHPAEDTPEPAHPTKLVTEDDYRGAPVGTIVGDYLARPTGKAEVMWQKLEDGRWWSVGGSYYANLAGESRAVIRWGDLP